MFCKSCGTYMEDSYNVCQNCGARKGTGTSFCEGCGKVRQVGQAFCDNCGAKYIDVPAADGAATPYAQQTPAQQFQSQAQADNSQYLPPKKFCRNCGKQVMNNQVVCTACGVKVGDGNAFCPHCAAPVANPEAVACTSCGMSLKKGFDFGKAAEGFGGAVAGIFKGSPKDIIIDYGTCFISVITLIMCFIPVAYVWVGSKWGGISYSENLNVFQSNGFAGFLFIIALVVSILKFFPPVEEFLKGIPTVGRYISFGAPGIMVVALIFLTISVLNGAAYAAGYGGLVEASCGFTFGGWLLIIFVLAAVVLSVLSFLRKEGKVKI